MLKPLSLTGEELIFYNYKEPLKEVQGGYGYYGAILSSKDGSGIQCHICGKMFASLNFHLLNVHDGMTPSEYKEKFKLAKRTSLLSEEQRQNRKMTSLAWWKSLTKKERAEHIERRMQGIRRYWKSNPDMNKRTWKESLETKNKKGTCPEQLLDKIREVAKELGRTPSKREFADYFGTQGFLHNIYVTYGSWIRAKELAGFGRSPNIPTYSGKRYTKEEVIELLQIFYRENGKPPTGTDCRRGLLPGDEVIKRLFGSFPAAREAAGIYEEMGRWKMRKGLSLGGEKNSTQKEVKS